MTESGSNDSTRVTKSPASFGTQKLPASSGTQKLPASSGTQKLPASSGTQKSRSAPSDQANCNALRMAVSIPSANTSILKNPNMSRSSLSHGMTDRFSI